MKEAFYPSPQELIQPPKNLKENLEQQCHEQGVDFRDVLPQEIAERLDDYTETIKTALVESYGVAEIPKELSNEMDALLKEIES